MSQRVASLPALFQRLTIAFGNCMQHSCDIECRLAIAFHLPGGEASDSRNFETLLDIGPDQSARRARRQGLRLQIKLRGHTPSYPLFSSVSHFCNWTPFNNSSLVGIKGAMKGSLPILGGKSDVVVIMPFDASCSPDNTPSSDRTAS